MTDTANPDTSNGDPANPRAEVPAANVVAAADAAPAPASSADNVPETAAASRTVKVREAISLIKEHPLGAVATVAAATALLEIEFAVGVLAGLGATALLSKKSGAERRKMVLERGRWALDRARAMRGAALKKRAAAVRPPPAPPASPV